MPTQLDLRQSVYRLALNMAGTAVNATADTIVASNDVLFGKLYEDRNVTLTDGGIISFSGTSVTFSEALKLIINSQIAGGTPTVIDLSATTRAFSADGRMLYAVINRLAGTAVVTADAATLPAVSNANDEVYLIAKRRDTGGGIHRIYFRNGVTLTDGGNTGDLLPALDNTYNIGSATLRWKDLYLSDKMAVGLTTTPTFNIDVQNDVSAPVLRLRSSVAQIPAVYMDSNRTANGQNLSQIRTLWNGTDVARIASFSGGSFAGAKDDAQLSFQTKATGLPLTEHLLIDTFGNITASANVSDFVTWIAFNIASTYSSTVNESTSSRALRVQLTPNVSTGVTQSSSSVAQDIISTRSLSTDLGTLGSITALRVNYGNVTGVGATASTGPITGVSITPNYQAGTVTGDAMSLFIGTALTGGTFSGTLYGVYQQDANALNFFNGFLNIGNLNPSSATPLYVDAKTNSLAAVFNSTNASGVATKYNRSGSAVGYVGSGTVIASGGFYTPVAGDFGIDASVVGGTGRLLFASSDSVRAIIDPSGNFGIGTQPATLFHVKDNTATAVFRLEGSGNNSAVIQFWGSSTVTSNWRVANNATITGAFEIARQLTSTPTYAAPALSIGPADTVGIGESPDGAHALIVAGPGVTGVIQRGIRSDFVAGTGATTAVDGIYSSPATSATTGTLVSAFAFHAQNFGTAGRTVTTQYGFYADTLSTGGTNNYAFYSGQTSAQNGSYHFYGNGDALTFFGGATSIAGALTLTVGGQALTLNGSNPYLDVMAGGTNNYFGSSQGLVTGGSTTDLAIRAQNNMIFAITTSERMRLNSSGNLLIGRTSDSGLGVLQTDGNLDISNSSAGAIIRSRSGANQQASLYLQNATTGTTATDGFSLFMNTDNISSYVWNYESGPLIFGTSNAERWRIDSAGRIASGGSVDTASMISIDNAQNQTVLSTTSQYGLSSFIRGTSAATVGIAGVTSAPASAAAAFTVANMDGFLSRTFAKGAGSTITRAAAFRGVRPTVGTNNALITDDSNFGAGNWFIYNLTTDPSWFSGQQIMTGTGTTSVVFQTNEGLSLSVASPVGGSSSGASFQNLVSSSTASSSQMDAVAAVMARTTTANVTDTNDIYSIRSVITINPSTATTYTQSSTNGIASIVAGLANNAGAGTSAIAVSTGVQIRNGTAAATRAIGLNIQPITAGTNNAFIADNTAFTGSWFINSTSANSSRFTGNVGIGGDPTYQLDVQATNNPILAVRYSNNSGTNTAELRFLSTNASFLGDYSGIRATQGGGVDTHDLEFSTSNAGAAVERMRIEANGRVAIGEIVPLAANIISDSGANSWFGVTGNSTNAYPMILSQIGNNTSGGTFTFYKTRATTGAFSTTVNSGDNVAVLLFNAANGTAYKPAARISVAIDGTPSSTSMPGRIVFETTTAGTNVLTERMRIDNSGQLVIATAGQAMTFTGSNPYLDVQAGGTNNYFGSSAGLVAGGSTTDLAIRAQNNMIFAIGTAEKMRLDSSGHLGVGVTPLTFVHFKDTATTVVRIDGSAGDNSAVIQMWGSSTVTSNWRIANNATISGAFEIARQLTSTPTFASPAFSIGSTDNAAIGESPAAGHGLIVAGPNLTGITQHGIRSDLSANAAATNQINAFYASPATSATTGTVTNVFGFHSADAGTAGRTISSQFGFYVDTMGAAGTNNYAFFSNQTTTQTGAYHFFGNGNAPSFFGGVAHFGNLNPSSAAGIYVDAKTVGLGATFNSTNASGININFKNSGTALGFIGAGTQISSGGFYTPNINDFGMDVTGAHSMILCTNDVARVLIDSTGRVGIGVTPAASLDVTNISTTAGIRVAAATNGSGPGYKLTCATRTGTENVVEIDNTTSASSFIILANGAVRAGVSATVPDVEHDFQNTSTTNYALGVKNRNTTTSSDSTPALYVQKGSTTATSAQRFIQFINNDGGTNQGYITANAGTPQFTAASDFRIKKDIAPIAGALAKILALNPVTYTLKATENKGIGFIAQEFAEVFPDQVDKTDDGKGTEMPQGVEPWTMSEGRLIPFLVKSIQELKEQIDALTAQLAALKV